MFGVSMQSKFTLNCRPVLYVVWAAIIGTLTVFFLLTRPLFPLLEIVRVFLGVVLVVTLSYLFARERSLYVR